MTPGSGLEAQVQAHSGAAQAAAPPPPATATAPLVRDDEAVWRLLLGQLWEQPDAALVCRLLCCSAAMGQLVHEECVGRCAATKAALLGAPASTGAQGQPSVAPASCSGAWLVKHGRLLASLDLRVARSRQHLLHGCNLRTFFARAADQQAALLQHLAAVVRGLPHLRELSLRATIRLPRLRLGTRLTRLQLLGPEGWSDAPSEALRALPPSLLHLDVGNVTTCEAVSLEGIAHLTALRRLRCVSWEPSATGQLPLSLEELEVESTDRVDVVRQLRHLTRLQRLTLGHAAGVAAAIGGAALQPLVDCIVRMTGLRRLSVYDVGLTMEQEAALKALTHLTHLHVCPHMF